MDCLFCKIISGDVPSHKVYEDDNVLAFLDIAPVNYGHVIVIPKKHYANLEEISDKELSQVMEVVKKIGKSLKDNLEVSGYNICENNDPVAGQVVPHVHFHVIPRKEGDGLELWPQGRYGDGEAEEIAKKIKV